jgi:hypothetical protein
MVVGLVRLGQTFLFLLVLLKCSNVLLVVISLLNFTVQIPFQLIQNSFSAAFFSVSNSVGCQKPTCGSFLFADENVKAWFQLNIDYLASIQSILAIII